MPPFNVPNGDIGPGPDPGPGGNEIIAGVAGPAGAIGGGAGAGIGVGYKSEGVPFGVFSSVWSFNELGLMLTSSWVNLLPLGGIAVV